MVDSIYEKKILFLSKLVEAEPQLACWIELFAEFGIGEQKVSHLVSDIWYIQDRLK